MRLNPPKKIVWSISFWLGIIGTVGHIFTYFLCIPLLAIASFWVVFIALLLLLLGNTLKGF